MSQKPWTLLDPNDFESMWWRKMDILDTTLYSLPKENKYILAYHIIQDGNMGGNFWHVSYWYICDPNRYNTIISSNQWPFNKELTEMMPEDIVYLIENPNIKFNVYYSLFGSSEQKNFCKILERNLFS